LGDDEGSLDGDSDGSKDGVYDVVGDGNADGADDNDGLGDDEGSLDGHPPPIRPLDSSKKLLLPGPRRIFCNSPSSHKW